MDADKSPREVVEAEIPFHKRGENAFAKRISDRDSYKTSNKYADYDFKVGKPQTHDVEGEHATKASCLLCSTSNTMVNLNALMVWST